MKTLIVFALPLENQLKSVVLSNTATLICGAGKVLSASKLAKHLSTHKYDHIINLGICGTIDLTIPVNTIFAINEAIEGDNPHNGKGVKLTLNLLNPGNLPLASIVTQDRVINTEEQRIEVEQLKSFLVDMECYALAKTARTFNIPFSAIKIVTDHCNSKTDTLTKEDIINSSKILIDHFLQFFTS